MVTNRMERFLRPFLVGSTLVILAVAVYIWVALHQVIDAQSAVGVDLEYYRFVARRWLETGVYFTEAQLAGPFVVETLVTNLYPPHALYLFIPFLVLPAILWWVLPLGLIAYVVWWCRPAMWAWPIIALIVLYPKTPNQIIYGNTDMWVVAAAAAGVRWAWPSVLVTFKPSLVFLAVIGIGSRSWWIAAAVLALISLPLLGLWLQYPTVMRNSSATALYSLSNLPFFVLPVVAWMTSSRRGDISVGAWAARLLRGAPPRSNEGVAS